MREIRSGCTEPYSSLVVHFLLIYPKLDHSPGHTVRHAIQDCGSREGEPIVGGHIGCTETVDEGSRRRLCSLGIRARLYGGLTSKLPM